MSTFTTDNIDRLRGEPLGTPGLWRITFRSANAGMHHQLYINGRLADWTDTPDQRSFILQAASAPRELLVAAVEACNRLADFSGSLEASRRRPAWAWRGWITRGPRYARGTRVAVLHDRATGVLDGTPADVRDIWPASAPRWMWGEDAFGLGGFGFDGRAAPGLGMGAFGAGMFGLDEALVGLEAEMCEDGVHQVVLRVIAADGSFADGAPQSFAASPPPAPAELLAAQAYDVGTDTLTLQIQ
ncbi:MAG: hypothetical protein ACE15C_19210 [Phycisphaerae bacterium]